MPILCSFSFHLCVRQASIFYKQAQKELLPKKIEDKMVLQIKIILGISTSLWKCPSIVFSKISTKMIIAKIPLKRTNYLRECSYTESVYT
jgi:hypothetical protein